MQEYRDRHEIENFYEKAKKRIKEQIALKGVDMKGGAKGQALTEIINVLDKELEINIGEELVNARKLCRAYYKKYYEVSSLDHEISEKKRELEEQNKIVSLVSLLTDETLKNAIIAYNAIKDTSRDSHNAKEIAIAYITSKGREDLKDVIEVNNDSK